MKCVARSSNYWGSEVVAISLYTVVFQTFSFSFLRTSVSPEKDVTQITERLMTHQPVCSLTPGASTNSDDGSLYTTIPSRK